MLEQSIEWSVADFALSSRTYAGDGFLRTTAAEKDERQRRH